MGALKGRMGPLGYYVKGKVEDWEQVLDNLTRYRFQELTPTEDKQQSFGWVRLTDPFATEFDKPGIFFGESVVGLGMRVDSINIPSSQLKLHLSRRAALAAKEAGKDRLSKGEMTELRENLIAEFSRKVLPTIKVFDMAFHTGIQRLWFFGKAKPVVQTFVDLFYETFGLSLVPDSPYTVARELLGEEDADLLLNLDQAEFVGEID